MNKQSINQQNTEEEVENGCRNPIKIVFDTFFVDKRILQQDLADYLNVDKSYISRIVHGKEIPPLRIRIKIADFFSTPEHRVDSASIWKYQDMDYIRKVLKKQKKGVKNG